MPALTKRKAEAAHRAVMKRYASLFEPVEVPAHEFEGVSYPASIEGPALTEADQPKLIKGWHGDGQGHWVIAWDAGPYEWAYRASGGGIDPEMAAAGREFGFEPKEEAPIPMPAGVFAEPVNTCVLGLYPD